MTFPPDIDWVSCDIFDTAVFRVVAAPRDVFLLLEQALEIPGFAQARAAAAKATMASARARGEGEYTLEGVYAELVRVGVMQESRREEALRTEEDLEVSLARANPEVAELIAAARRAGKKICFTTDMYLPRPVIVRILESCGYSGYDQLLLSRDDGLTKSSGRRFERFLDADKSRVWHIGDREKGDFLRPREHGIRAERYAYCPYEFFSPRMFAASKKSGDAFCSLAAGLSRMRAYASYWEAIGYQYLGPFLVAFSLWLKESNVENRRLCFLARDGEVMRRVYLALFPEEADRTEYLLASRALATNAECEAVYREYLKAHGFGHEPIAVVDVGRNGTIQKAMMRLLPQADVRGFYGDLRVDDPSMEGFFTHVPSRFRRTLDFLDFLFISPSSQTVALRRTDSGFEPETLPIDDDEAVRQRIAPELQAGAEAFALDVRPFLKPWLAVDRKKLLAAVNSLKRVTELDVRYMANVKVPFGKRNEKFRYLTRPDWSWCEILRHPLRYLNGCRKRILK